jgi:1,4-alpha-glucan branching enzyme
MGIADYWIKLIKETADEHWPIGPLWHELTNRREDEKTVSYAESHDQALVGDQSIIFRLIGKDMYDHMHISDEHLRVDRGLALHKMIRLVTLATAGDGYLNFMGNEFGHPEWIDFPREGNNWSCKYARRQWHLVDEPNLKYQFLARFDRDMISLARKHGFPGGAGPRLLHEHSDDKVLAFERAGLLFAFNFHPQASYTDYRVDAPAGKYRLIFDSDAPDYGGHNRLTPGQAHFTLGTPAGSQRSCLRLYLPARSAQVLQLVRP